MEDYKQIIAKNIAALRGSEKMTQAELAEKLNYSDKAISKWERGESIPDVGVLKQIADMFGVTVDWLLTENHSRAVAEKGRKRRNHIMVTLLAISGAWFAAAVVFVGMLMCRAPLAWLSFVAAVPVSCILALIFNSIWGKRRNNLFIISGLIWSLFVFVYLLLVLGFRFNFWPIFLVGIPAQAATIIAVKIEKK